MPIVRWVLGSRLRFILTLCAALAAVAVILLATRPGGHQGGSLPGAARQGSSAPTTPAAASARQARQGSGTSAGVAAWLPFTQQDLAGAGAVTARFCADYNTYSYDESASAYVGKMNGLITSELATTLRAGYTVPGVAKLRTDQKEVSTGTAVIDSLRAFGPSSLTFVVDATQHLVTSRGASDGSAQYAVTLTRSGGTWQVSDIELGAAGNS